MEIDKDLAARQEARLLCRQAEAAQKLLASFSQEKLDAIVENIAKKFSAAADELAWMAVEETGFGNAADNSTKNHRQNYHKGVDSVLKHTCYSDKKRAKS